MTRGLLLDLDGVLCDSLPALRGAYATFLTGFGRQASDAEFETLNGPPLGEIVRLLIRAHALEADPAHLLVRYRSLVDAAHAAALPAPGAAELLAGARAAGWKIAVVTSAPEASASAWLARNGLAPDLLVHGEMVARGKPDPEPYLAAADRLGCASADCLAVEDSAQGALAALSAGAKTLFLGSEAPAAVAAHPRFAGTLARLSELRTWLQLLAPKP